MSDLPELALAAWTGDIKKLKELLVECPEDINPEYEKLAMLAASRGHTEIIYFLLRDCSPELRLYNRPNAFGEALEHHYFRDKTVMGLFIERAKEEGLGSHGFISNIAHKALDFGVEEIVPFTVSIIDQLGIDPASLETIMWDLDRDYTSDNEATIERLVQLWNLLVSYKVVAKSRTDHGTTQLHLGCQNLPPKYHGLLKNLGNPFARDLDGDKPEDLARTYGRVRQIRFGLEPGYGTRKGPENAEYLVRTVAELAKSCDIDQLMDSTRDDDDYLSLADYAAQRHNYGEALECLDRVRGSHRILADALSATLVWKIGGSGCFEAAMSYLGNALNAAEEGMHAPLLWRRARTKQLNDDPAMAQQDFRLALEYEKRPYERQKLKYHHDIASLEVLLGSRRLNDYVEVPFEIREIIASKLLVAYQQEIDPLALVIRHEDAPDKRSFGPLTAVGNI